MANAEETVLDLLYGRWRSQTLHAGVSLNVFEHVDDRPRAASEVADALQLDATLAYRLLRALGSLGLLQETAGQQFAVTEAGGVLRSDHPQSLRDVVLLREGPEHTAIWKHLAAIVRDGGGDGFVREFGKPAFEYAAQAPVYAAQFDAGMSSHSRLQTGWVLDALRDRDFSSIAEVCDIGGGQGHLLCHLLAQHAHLSGVVLERPGLLARSPVLWAERLGLTDRCHYVAGDMFVDVPQADAYLMKMILHDWNDDECVRILANAHRRARSGGRIFIIEHMISTADTGEFAALFDMHMMCWGTGRERTTGEYAALLETAGWAPAATRFSANGIIGVIEAVAN